jgi:hypothetical protein
VACAALEATAAKRAAALGGALKQMRGALAAEAARAAGERAPAATASAVAEGGGAMAPNAAGAAGPAAHDAEKRLRSVIQKDSEQTLLGVWRGWIKGSAHTRMGYEAPGPPCENGSPRRAFVTMR